MVNRAFDLGLIDQEARAIMFQNMSRRRWRRPLGEPFDDLSVMPLERPRMLRRAIDTVFNNGIFGRASLRTALPLPQVELENLLGVSPGFLGDGQVMPLPRGRPEKFEAMDLESGKVLEFVPRKKT